MEAPFRSCVHLRWADIDANFHLRHSVYYDLCAQQRMEAMERVGITMATMKELHIGPVIFREECRFRREIHLHEEVHIDLAVRGLSHDHGRFAFRHRIAKSDGTLCATLEVEGAWIDTKLRKLCAPPPMTSDALDHMPRTEDFAWIEKP